MYWFQSNREQSIFSGPLPKLLFIGGRELSLAPVCRPLHQHEAIAEINFIFEGTGQFFVDKQSYLIGPGDILLVNAGSLHELIAMPGKTLNTYCFGITDLALCGLPKNHLTDAGSGFVRSAGEQKELFSALCKLLAQQLLDTGKGSAELCQHLLASLVLWSIRAPNTQKVDGKGPEFEMVNRIKAFIDENYIKGISLEAISSKLGISPYYAAHLFKEEIGYSPIHYMIRRRIGTAQSLLISSDESVSRIAALVGYEHTSHFNTAFSKLVGMSPLRYRKFFREACWGEMIL